MAITNPTSVAPYVSGTPNSSLCRVAFRVQSAGAATTAPDFVIPAGACTTATHASTGVYSVVVAGWQRLGQLVSGQVTVLGATGTTNAVVGHVVSYVTTTGVLTFDTYNLAATPAIAIVADNDWICLDLVFAQDVGAEGTTTALA